ncbi:MAG: transposase [Spirochaetota bacterium]|nr:transposase [Spirochaetota bacterium]
MHFDYSKLIQKMIYTTNIIEGLNRQIRKVTKTKGAFVSEKALLKQVYMVLENVSSRWTQPIQNWSLTLSQLSIKFKERLELDLNINF